jgi:hypothetical protein
MARNIAPASSFGKSLAALAEQLGEPYRKEGRSGRQERERFVGRQDHFFLVAQVSSATIGGVNAILAGASGFTGGHLARELASRRDAQVTALVRKTTQALERPVKQVVCDFARALMPSRPSRRQMPSSARSGAPS